MVSLVSSEQWTASSAVETECSVLSGYSENQTSCARSGGGVQRISEQPGMIIRVVQMGCEVYSSFGSVQCILNQSNIKSSGDRPQLKSDCGIRINCCTTINYQPVDGFYPLN